MSLLKVTVVADGVSREFVGEGPTIELIAAFRVWVSGPDLALPFAEGVASGVVDQADRAAAVATTAAEAVTTGPEPRTKHQRAATDAPDVRAIRVRVRGVIAGLFIDDEERSLFEVSKAVGLRARTASMDDVRLTLSQMAAEGAIDVRQVGTDRRYRRRPGVPA